MKRIMKWAIAAMLPLLAGNVFGQIDPSNCDVYIEKVRLWDNSYVNASGPSPGNYADYTDNCIPFFETNYQQININASQGNVYIAMFADFDNDGIFETQIINFLDGNGATGVSPSFMAPNTPIRIIVSAQPITDASAIPTCGEVEDYIICGEDEINCADCLNLFGIELGESNGCKYEFYLDYAVTGQCGSIQVVSHDWNFGHAGGTASTINPNIYHQFPGNGTYNVTGTITYVVVSTGDTCTAQVSKEIDVQDCSDCECVGTGNFQTFDLGNCKFGFMLNGSSVGLCGTLIPTYTWDFGDGTTATSSSPLKIHTYSTSGTYTVTISFDVVDNNAGEVCTTTIATTIHANCSEGKPGKSLTEHFDLAEFFEVNAFPNPSKDYVTFSFNDVFTQNEANQTELVVYDQTAREVYRAGINGATEHVLDVRAYQTGLYIYRIVMDGQILNVGKITVK